MATLGRFDQFVEDGDEDFESYVERFEHFLKASKVSDDLKVSTFITAIGKKPYKTLKTLLEPEKPESQTYAQLVKALQEHYSPKPLVIAERFKFNRRFQQEGESIAAFAVELKRLASSCDFKAFLDDALRDRFVAGLSDKETQAQLLKKSTLTFAHACDIAKSIELARKESQEFQPSHAQGTVSALRHKPDSGRRPLQRRRNSSATTEPAGARASEPSDCFRCGSAHEAATCKFRKYRCRSCKRYGHLAKMCRAGSRDTTNLVVGDSDGDEVVLHNVYACEDSSGRYEVSLKVVQKNVRMQMDTGASVSIVPEALYKKYWSTLPLEPCHLKLKTYGGTSLTVMGKLSVPVEHNGQQKQLPLVVVKTRDNSNTALLGRDWLAALQLDWSSVHGVCLDKVAALLEKYARVFEPTLGQITGTPVKLVLKEGSTPVFCKARQVPFALREAVSLELQSLVKTGVLVPVQQSDWATPLVVVPKPNNQVRVCGDFKITLNPCLRTDHYPLPIMEDLFVMLSGCKYFTVLDLSTAYQQLALHPEAQSLVVVNTHLGLFKYTRLPYGITSAPAIFQAVMDDVLKGLDRVSCYLDDVLIAGSTIDECFQKVESVLSRFQERGIRLKKEKCKFFQTSVSYLGHILDEKGVRPSDSKVKAIKEAPTPKNEAQLRAYLGLINFYGKFVPNIAARLRPMFNALNHEKGFQWSREAEHAFQLSKTWLTQDNVLTYYDPTKEIGLVCDASAYGVGAILFHKIGKDEKPIAYASRALSKAEQGYAHIEKEALAVVFGLKKFHKYLFGRSFVIYSDHQPLAGLLGHGKPVPVMSAARMQRWALLLAAYDYRWVYRKGSDVGNADALSRLPLANENDVSDYVHFFSVVDEVPLSSVEIQKCTSTDRVLSKVLMYTMHGWPAHVKDSELSPYFVKRHELSVDQQCVTWGNRVIIPKELRKKALRMLHEGHPGMTRMKMLARSYVWWPQLTQDIESVVKSCSTCQLTQNASPSVPLQTWGWPTRRWQRIHLDFAFTDDQWFLVLVDAHSKWVEVFVMKSTTADKTIEKLRSVFASYGLPEEVVTDNGPQFTARTFANFLQKNGVRHTRTPPYHPASNGSAERCVQTVKRDLLRQLLDERTAGITRTLQHRIDLFLFRYRNTPTATTGQTPAELFLSWKPRTRLSLLQPSLETRMQDRFSAAKNKADERRGSWRSFEVEDRVLVQGLRPGEAKWLPGVVKERCSATTYIVRVGQGHRFVHADNLRPCSFEGAETVPSAFPCVVPSSVADSVPEEPVTRPPLPALESSNPATPQPGSMEAAPPNQQDPCCQPSAASQSPHRASASPQQSEVPRRSTRNRKPPDWYKP